MLLSAVSVLVVAQSSSEIPEGLMNNPVDKSTGFPPNTTNHLLQHTYMFRHTYMTTTRLTNKQGHREWVWAPVKNFFRPPTLSKGGAAKNIYTKSERLSLAE